MISVLASRMDHVCDWQFYTQERYMVRTLFSSSKQVGLTYAVGITTAHHIGRSVENHARTHS